MTTGPVAVDTSVAIPLVVATHVAHAAVSAWADGRRLVLSGHAAIEAYAVLTRLPGDARVAPQDALALLSANFEAAVEPTVDVRDNIARLAARGVSGAATYDALVAAAALDHGFVLATRDARARETYDRMGVRFELVPSE